MLYLIAALLVLLFIMMIVSLIALSDQDAFLKKIRDEIHDVKHGLTYETNRLDLIIKYLPKKRTPQKKKTRR